MDRPTPFMVMGRRLGALRALTFALFVTRTWSYLPAQPTNDTSLVTVVNSAVHLQWSGGTGLDYDAGASYQLKGNDTTGIDSVRGMSGSNLVAETDILSPGCHRAFFGDECYTTSDEYVLDRIHILRL